MPQWITDAQLAHDIRAIHLHQNADIEAFLDRGNQTRTIIVASKGMGKTLVMRHKRDLLQRSVWTRRPAYCFHKQSVLAA